MRGVERRFFVSLARLFSLKDRCSLCKHGVQCLHVIFGEVAQRLIGCGMHHALFQGGMDAHAQHLFWSGARLGEVCLRFFLLIPGIWSVNVQGQPHD